MGAPSLNRFTLLHHIDAECHVQKDTTLVWSIVSNHIFSNRVIDTFYFYVETIAHLRVTRTHWKGFKYYWPKLKQLIFVQWKHVLYWYKTQNPPSQPAKHPPFDYSRLIITKSADLLTFLIKQGRSTCFAFFFWIFSGKHRVFCKYNGLVNQLKNWNVNHGDPERPLVTNPSGKLSNMNMWNWTMPFMKTILLF